MSSIFPRNGWYHIKYYENGKAVQYSLKTKDKGIAKQKQKEIDYQLAVGDSPAQRKTGNIEKLKEDYLDFVAGTISPVQLSHEKTHLREFLAFCNSPLRSINGSVIKKFLDSREVITGDERRPIADRTWNSYLITLKKFFKFVTKKKYLRENPADEVKIKKLPRNPPSWLSDGDDEKVLNFAQKNYPEYYPLLATGILAGLRISELLNMEWKDVTWGEGEKRGIILVQNKASFKTKSRTYRRVPLSSQLEAILKPLSRAKGYCFFSDEPGRLDYFKHRKRLKKILTGAKVEIPKYKAFHILRHTFGTKHGRAGRSSLKLGDWMGHKSPETTKGYTHFDPADKEIDDI